MVNIVFRSFRGRNTNVFSLFLFLVLLYYSTQVSATSNRCDYKKPVTYWTRCQECSINRQQRCPAPYIHTSGAAGVRGCPIRIHFGSVIGVVKVAGCRHTCVKIESFRKCCAGFWGGRCEGTNQLEFFSVKILVFNLSYSMFLKTLLCMYFIIDILLIIIMVTLILLIYYFYTCNNYIFLHMLIRNEFSFFLLIFST